MVLVRRRFLIRFSLSFSSGFRPMIWWACISIGEEISGLSCFRLSHLDLSFKDVAPSSGDFPLINPMILFALLPRKVGEPWRKSPIFCFVLSFLPFWFDSWALEGWEEWEESSSLTVITRHGYDLGSWLLQSQSMSACVMQWPPLSRSPSFFSFLPNYMS